MTGTSLVEGAATASAAPLPGALVSLPPKSSSPDIKTIAGRLPTSDSATEVVLTDRTAVGPGFCNPAWAIGSTVDYNATSGTLVVSGPPANPVSHQLVLPLQVVGIISRQYIPAGSGGGMVPYSVAKEYWTRLSLNNGWKTGEFANITLLADSGGAVDGLRNRLTSLGFPAPSFRALFPRLSH